MKLGIFAGTFDPVHLGHLDFVQAALQQADLGKVILVAEKSPYRKQPHATWDHRQAMIERATQTMDKIDHNYQFADQLAHQHTMQDMLRLAAVHYPSAEIWFLVGVDSFEHLHKWQDVARMSQYGGFVVALRAGYDTGWLNNKLLELKQQGREVRHKLVRHKEPDISSGLVRDNLAAAAQYLPVTVQSYISQHKLYGTLAS